MTFFHFRFSLLLTLLCALSLSANAEDLKVGVWGADVAKTISDSIAQSWNDRSDSKAIVESDNELMRKVRTDEHPWDVIALSGRNEQRLCSAGKLANLSQEITDSLGHLSKSPNCGVPFLMFGQTIAFNPNDENSPSGIADLFDTERFPGHRGLSASPVGTLELALLADGVGPDSVYAVLSTEEGVERALNKLQTIKSDIVWWSSGHQAVEMLTRGDLVMSTAWSGQIDDAKKQGVELATTPQFMLVEYEYLAVPSGLESPDLASSFVAHAASAEGLQALYRGFQGRLSVPSEAIDRSDIITVQACSSGQCPCRGGGCSSDCCDSSLGHFEIDPTFWNNNSGPLTERFRAWQQ